MKEPEVGIFCPKLPEFDGNLGDILGENFTKMRNAKIL